MYKRTIFGAAKTSDGYISRPDGKNLVLLKRHGAKFYVFFEYQHTDPIKVQLDTSGVWLDRGLKRPVTDEHLKADIIDKAIGYFAFVGIALV